MDKNKISELTIEEFKNIIREVVKEEIAKCNFKEIQYVPMREQWYGPTPQYPWQQQVWCSNMSLRATGNMNENGVIE